MSHFLQSPAWREFQKSLGHEVIEHSGSDWHYLAIVESSGGFKRLYCPYGPVVESEAALGAALTDLTQQAKRHKAVFIRVQPTGTSLSVDTLAKHGLSPVTYSQPTRTWLLDLAPSFDELLAGMKQNTRNICRNYQKKGMKYRQSTDPTEVATLIRLLKNVAEHNHITVHSDAYFGAQSKSLLPIGAGKLHFIEHDNQVIAAALTYESDGVVAYAHAAADFEHRSLGASTALLGEIIRDARARGFETLDFFGIAPSDDPHHKQAGFTKFKQSFGGYAYNYAPTCEMPIAPIAYRLYRLLRKIR